MLHKHYVNIIVLYIYIKYIHLTYLLCVDFFTHTHSVIQLSLWGVFRRSEESHVHNTLLLPQVQEKSLWLQLKSA